MGTKIRKRQIANGAIDDSKIQAGAGIQTSKLSDGAKLVQKDGSVAFEANQSMGTKRLTNVGNAVSSGDAVNLGMLTEALNHIHEQNIPASTWTIVHGLGFRPNVRVRSSAGDYVQTTVVDIDNNTLQILLDNAMAGEAYCS